MFKKYNKILLILGVIGLLQACTQIDDYMLGKDNTPTPTPLGDIKPQISLTERWTVLTGKPSKAHTELKLDPVLNGGVIYTASADGVVQATDKNTGKILWSKQLPHHLLSGPAVASGRVAVTTNAATVVVLNQNNGDILWKADISSDSLAKPVIHHQKVLVKTIDGNLYAFLLKSGEKLWVVDHGSPGMVLKASSAPVILDKVALVGFSDGKLDAVELDSGRTLWQRNIAYASGGSDVERLVDIDADPIVHGDVVYLASYQGYVGALSLKNGEFTWRKPASIYKNILFHDQTLFFVDNDGVVWAMDATGGQVRWKQPALKAHGLTEPVLIGNRLLVGDKSGFLHGLNIQNGELVSRTQVSGAVLAAPVVSGSNVYVLTANGRLSRFSVS